MLVGEYIYIGNKKSPLLTGFFYVFICISLLFIPYCIAY